MSQIRYPSRSCNFFLSGHDRQDAHVRVCGFRLVPDADVTIQSKKRRQEPRGIENETAIGWDTVNSPIQNGVSKRPRGRRSPKEQIPNHIRETTRLIVPSERYRPRGSTQTERNHLPFRLTSLDIPGNLPTVK